MDEKRVYRVMPESFDGDWEAELKEAEVRMPEELPELRYSPVGHDPVPFALVIDAVTGEAVRRIVGVMPNALYGGRIYMGGVPRYAWGRKWFE